MATRHRRRFLVGTLTWWCGTVLALAALDALTLELFFVGALLGTLVVTELTAPLAVTPRWRRRVRVILAVGLVAFVLLVIRRVLAVLPPGVP